MSFIAEHRWRRFAGTLKFQIAALGVSVAVGVAWLSAWVVMSVGERQTIELLLDADASAVQRTAMLVSSKIDVLRSTLTHAADTLSVQQIEDPAAMQAFLAGLAPLQALYDHLFVAGHDGVPRAMVGFRDRGNPIVESAQQQHAQAVLRSRHALVSAPVLQADDGEPLVTFGVPVIGADGKVVGVMGGTLALRSVRLLSLDNDPDTAADVRTLVLTHEGEIVLHPDDERLLGRAADEPGLRTEFARWASLGPALGVAPSAVHADGHLVSMAVVPSTGWKVVRLVPETQAFASLAQAQRHAWQFGALLALLSGVLAAWLAVRLTRPIDALEQRAARLFDNAAGTDQAWPRAGGEIGRLADTLRRVADERRESQREMQYLHERLVAILEHAPMGLAFARSSRFELVSRHLAHMFGSRPEDLQGQSTRVMYASDADRSDLVARAKSMFASSGSFDGEARLVHADGGVFWGRLRARAVHQGDVAAGTIWIVEDVTHAREQRQQLSWAADHDALTGLANRASFDRRLTRAVDEDRPFCALFMDLDRFKQVNDNAGHAAGDRVLRDVAELIGATLRQTDLVARLGGDEFGALLLDCPPERAIAVAEAIRRAVELYRLEWQQVVFSIGISIGVVHRDDSLDTVARLMHAADTACYAAKRGGRNRVVLYEAGQAAAQAA